MYWGTHCQVAGLPFPDHLAAAAGVQCLQRQEGGHDAALWIVLEAQKM